jgi:hypothetical protein
MRIAGSIALGLAIVLLQGTGSDAQEKKDVTLKGKICCPKCELGTADDCGTVVVVKEKGKEVVYTFDAASNKKYHTEICNTPKNGTVMAVVTDAKKRTIMVKKVTFE